jgi:hypothetical protein
VQDASVHPISPAFRRQMALAGLCSLAFAVGFALLLYLDPPEEVAGRVVVTAVAVFGALFATWGIRFAVTCGSMAVSAGRDGIRVGVGDWIEWAAVARVRERAWLQRVDLIGHDGHRLASIEYQVEGVDELLDLLKGRMQRPLTIPRQRFGRRFPAVYLATSVIVCGAFVALGVWLWRSEGQWIGLLVPPVLLWGLHAEFRDQIRELELHETALVLRTVLRERVVLRQDIDHTELLLKPVGNGHLLSVLLVLRDGSSVWVHPVGQDAQDVYAAVESWLGARGEAA